MMNNTFHILNINERILKTLRIVEERGYNLSLDKLSKYLIGGSISVKDLKREINNIKNIDFDGNFVATPGNLKTKKCLKKSKTNDKLKIEYLKIAQDFVLDYVNLCPFIECIMVAGSMASDGLGYDDDIDMNVVVKDGTKYYSLLIGILLSIIYSIKYREKFNVRWSNLIGKVICINVVWESFQVFPFLRCDERLAYELMLNTKVLYNRDFFKKILKKNVWLNNFFPQIYDFIDLYNDYELSFLKNMKKYLPRFVELSSRFIVFLIYYLLRATIFWHEDIIKKMDENQKIKYPYSVVDIPKIE